jgi:HEAT repeat protein
MRDLGLLALVFVQTLFGADKADKNNLSTDPEHAWRVLDDSLGSGSSQQRQEALAALSTFGTSDERAVKRAEAALHDKDALVRRSAAVALGELQAHSAIPSLKQTLDDDTPEVSFAAAEALTQLGDISGRDELIAVLAGERKDAPGILTNAMREAKNKLHHPEGLLLMGSEDAAGAMFGPASMAIPAIKDASDLKGKGAPGRAVAVAYLAKYPDAYVVQLLEWTLSDDNEFVCLEAAKALGDRGAAGSLEKLAPLLNDKHNIIRDMAATSMLRIASRHGEAGDIAPGSVEQPRTDKKK